MSATVASAATQKPAVAKKRRSRRRSIVRAAIVVLVLFFAGFFVAQSAYSTNSPTVYTGHVVKTVQGGLGICIAYSAYPKGDCRALFTNEGPPFTVNAPVTFQIVQIKQGDFTSFVYLILR